MVRLLPVLWVLGCAAGASGGDPRPAAPPDAPEASVSELPRVASRDQIRDLDGQRAVVVGTYTQVDVRARQRPPAVYRGHVAITLEDGAAVMLEPEWSEAALRSEDERAAMDGRKVEAVGLLHATTPEAPQPMAHGVGPTLAEIEAVRLVE